MDLPDSVVISEEGSREGFQIEPDPIAAEQIADRRALCVRLRGFRSALSSIPSVPGWADAEGCRRVTPARRR